MGYESMRYEKYKKGADEATELCFGNSAPHTPSPGRSARREARGVPPVPRTGPREGGAPFVRALPGRFVIFVRLGVAFHRKESNPHT